MPYSVQKPILRASSLILFFSFDCLKIRLYKLGCKCLTTLLTVPETRLKADVGLRRTSAYYCTSTRAMCVRKCVRKGFRTVHAEVRAYGEIFAVRFTIALFTLNDHLIFNFSSWMIWGQTILCTYGMSMIQ